MVYGPIAFSQPKLSQSVSLQVVFSQAFSCQKIVFRLAALPFALLLIAQAQAAPLAGESSDSQLQTIRVTATADDASSEKTQAYTVKNSTGGNRLDIAIKETPQTINVVTRQQLDDYQLTNLREVLSNTPGITVNNNETERTTYMSRGFEVSNVLVDGVGFPASDYNYNDTSPDTFLYDRVEVTKGADSMNTGFSDPGATVNQIRKRPTRDLQASGTLSYGSWDTQRVEGDISSSLTADGRVRARVMGYQQTGDSYLDRYSLEKNGLAAIVDADITDTTTLTAGYSETSHKPNANNWGALPLLDDKGQQISYDRSYNPNPEWAHWDNVSKNAFIELKQKIAEDWVAKLTYNHNSKARDSRLLYYYGYPAADGSGVSLTAWGGEERNKNNVTDLNLQGSFELFNRKHELAAGYSYAENEQIDLQTSGFINDANINTVVTPTPDGSYSTQYSTDWQSWTPQSVTWSALSEGASYKQKISSVYAVTRLHITEPFKTILGANYVKAESKGSSYGSPQAFDKDKILPYVGFTYDLNPEYTGYASYTKIFRPQTTVDQNTNRVANPIDGDSYEAGIKSSWLANRLNGTITVFRTTQNNYPLKGSDNPLKRSVPISDLRSQGVEFGLVGQLTEDLNLTFGYTQFELKDLKNGGKARTYNPDQTVNLLATYRVPQLSKLKVGAGLQWQDRISQYVPDIDGTIRQSGYALVNLMASYDLNEHISLQANGYNIGNKKYLFSFPDAQGYYGAPANYMLSLNVKY